MKAVIFNNYGPVEEFRFEEIDKPVASSDQVLLKIYETAVNHIDIAMGGTRQKSFLYLIDKHAG